MNENIITLRQAVSQYCQPYQYEALKRACQKGQIQGAQKLGIQWFVSPAAVMNWLANPAKLGRPARRVAQPQS